MNPIRLQSFALGLAIASLVSGASAEDIRVYRNTASLRTTQNQGFFLDTPQQLALPSVAGTTRITQFLLWNKDSGELVVFDYYTANKFGGRVREYTVTRRLASQWNGSLPSSSSSEYLRVAAFKTGTFHESLKSGFFETVSEDINNDNRSDSISQGSFSFLSGPAGPVKIGPATVPDVARRWTGVLREFSEVEYGPDAPNLFGRSFYQGSGNQTATLDVKLTADARAIATPADVTAIRGRLTAQGQRPPNSLRVEPVVGNGDLAHGLSTGEQVVWNPGSVNFPEFTNGETYYVVRIDPFYFQLALTLDNALADPPIVVNITSNNGNSGVISRTATEPALSVIEDVLQKLGFFEADAPVSPN